MFLIVSPHDLSYAVFGLVESFEVIEITKVETRPEGILAALLAFLLEHKLEPKELQGVVVVTGPGSFTALRSGLSVLNTFAFLYHLPLFPISNPDGRPIEDLMLEIDFSQKKETVIPEYGRGPNITSPRV